MANEVDWLNPRAQPFSMAGSTQRFLCACFALWALTLTTIASSENDTKQPYVMGVIGFGTKSHVNVFLRVEEELGRRGFRTSVASTSGHLHWMDGYNVTEVIDIGAAGLDEQMSLECYGPKPNRMLAELGCVMSGSFVPLLEPMIVGLLKEIEKDRPDVMICDMFADACVDVAHHLGIPFVSAHGPMGFADVGTDVYIPNLFDGMQMERSFWERVFDWTILPRIIYYYGPAVDEMNKIRAKLGISPSFSPSDKYGNAPILVNSLFGLEYARPLSPLIISVGPVDTLYKPMNDDYRTFVEGAGEAGVVLVSFGTHAHLEPREVSVILDSLEVARKQLGVPFRVIMSRGASDRDAFPAHPPAHVKIEDYVPQQDLLSHPNVKLFVSHGGLFSVLESITHGKPILVFGLCCDQPANGAKVTDAGNGLAISDRYTVTVDELSGKFARLLTEPSFLKHAQRLQKIANLSARSGINRGADVIELLATVGVDHLVPIAQSLPWYVRTGADMYAFFGGLAGVLVWLVLKVVFGLVGLVFGEKKKTKQA